MTQRDPQPFNPHWEHIPKWIFGASLFFFLFIMFCRSLESEADKELWKIRNQATEVLAGCREYARIHEGRWPASLQDLPHTYIRLSGAFFRHVTPDDWSHIVGDWSTDGRFTYHGYNPAEPPDKIVLEIWSAETPGHEVFAHANGIVDAKSTVATGTAAAQ